MTPNKALKLGPFLGENNRLPDTRLATQDGTFVRYAVNVDLSDSNTFKRRKGTALTVSGTDVGSLWSADGESAYFVDDGTIYYLDQGLTPISVISGVVRGRIVSYTDSPIGIHATDGLSLWKLSGVTASEACVKVPQSNPTLSASTGGSLPAGNYAVSVSHMNGNGEESGATYPTRIDIPELGVLTISGIPILAGHNTCLYVSPPDGDSLYRVSSAASGSIIIPVLSYTGGARCRNIGSEPMPAGDIVRYHMGRLVVAKGSILYFSDSFALHLTQPRKSFIQFKERITLLESCNTGLYVSADQTYWLPGDIASTEITPVLPYKAIENTGSTVPGEINMVWWMSERGVVIGGDKGEVKNLQEKQVAVPTYSIGATAYREQDGRKQYLASMFGDGVSPSLAAESWMSAEVIRKETQT